MTIEYVGFRRPDDGEVFVWVDRSEDDGGGFDRQPLPLYLDEVNHSPGGFQWSYGGSGPAQLAYALCRHATGDRLRAQTIYQDFKFAILAPMREDVFRFRQEALLTAIGTLERNRQERGRKR